MVIKRRKKSSETAGIVRMESPYAVEVDNLTVEYRTSGLVVQAVNGISLALKRKSTLGLVGETGAGKTTAMLALMNLIPHPPGVVKEGRVLVNGIDMLKLGPKELGAVRGQEIAMIFQDPMTSLNPVITVGEQIQESILLHEPVGRSEAWKRARDILATVGIDPGRAGEYPHQFSGGMRQRVGIAVALACRPSILTALSYCLKTTESEDTNMTGRTTMTMVNGTAFKVWSDFIARATFALNTASGEIKPIQKGGYIHNDLTVRKAIAAAWRLPTFRKTAKTA